MGGMVASVVCPLQVCVADLANAPTDLIDANRGPRIRSFVGRGDSHEACTDGLLPSPFADADSLIQLFLDKTIQSYGLAALLGAHSASQQRFLGPSRPGAPQDSTPGVWDTLYYEETLGSAPPRVLRFPSDIVLSEDPRVYPEFLAFASPGGQKHWNDVFSNRGGYRRVPMSRVY